MTFTIETARLRLRPFTREDAERILSGERPDNAWSEGFPREDDRDVARMFLSLPDGEPLFGPLLIELQSSGLVIGGIGLFGPPDETGTVGLGYGVAPEVEGRGYATEALRGLLHHAFADDRVRRAIADTDHGNAASQRVLEKAGMHRTSSDERLHHYALPNGKESVRTLTYYVATTLDGQIAGAEGGDPTGPDGFFTVAPDYLEHIVTHYPETLPGPARAALGVTSPGTRFDTVVEGRRSYQVGLDAGITDAYPHLRHLVFSRSLTESPDPAVELVAGDPVARIRELKAEEGGGIWLVGGAELAGALYEEIDELVLKVSPLTVGAGIPLFAGKRATDPRTFALVDQAVLPSGVMFLTYRRG